MSVQKYGCIQYVCPENKYLCIKKDKCAFFSEDKFFCLFRSACVLIQKASMCVYSESKYVFMFRK